MPSPLEPTIMHMRTEIKEGKKKIQGEDTRQQGNVDVFAEGSTGSDPSHSLLARDYFSKLLNPLAGRVAGVAANITQLVVKAWDYAPSDDD
ncbi:MAG: hypothetical protein M1831_001457 [Alyxoria varia]|nr:MAG: hypothetical protein M1831_001457 [Alyxoria varia]